MSSKPLERKPYLKGAPLVRLMCPPEFVAKLEKLNGKIVIWTPEGVVTLGGVELKFDGGYKSSFKWW